MQVLSSSSGSSTPARDASEFPGTRSHPPDRAVIAVVSPAVPEPTTSTSQAMDSIGVHSPERIFFFL